MEARRRSFKSLALRWMDVMRSYQGYYTRSHQNSEVKRLWAGIVLGWVTSREVPVLHPLFSSCFGISKFLIHAQKITMSCSEISYG